MPSMFSPAAVAKVRGSYRLTPPSLRGIGLPSAADVLDSPLLSGSPIPRALRTRALVGQIREARNAGMSPRALLTDQQRKTFDVIVKDVHRERRVASRKGAKARALAALGIGGGAGVAGAYAQNLINKEAGASTYPVSRFLTSPRGSSALGAVDALPKAALITAAGLPLLGAGAIAAGAGLAGGSAVVGRRATAGALRNRILAARKAGVPLDEVLSPSQARVYRAVASTVKRRLRGRAGLLATAALGAGAGALGARHFMSGDSPRQA
jgi:hypothetical protein